MVGSVHQSVVGLYPYNRGYGRVQEGLHELVNHSWHCEGRWTGRRCCWTGDGMSAAGWVLM